MTSQISDLEKVRSEIQKANSVFVITGAGMSADSGLPTYRGVGGLYDDQNTEDGIPIEVALSGSMFATRPELTWKYLGQIELATRGATFNRGHEVLAELESLVDRFWILTQNIDGFHAAAGSQNVIEIHGNMNRLRCTRCQHKLSRQDFSTLKIPPECDQCGGMLRPEVVLFDEQLPTAALSVLYQQLSQPFDVVMTIGTSNYFPYIVQPVYDAKRSNAFTVEINPADTVLSDIVDVKLAMGAANALDKIWAGFNSGASGVT